MAASTLGARSLVAAIKTIAGRKKQHGRICHMHAKRTRGSTRSQAARAAPSSFPLSFYSREEKKKKNEEVLRRSTLCSQIKANESRTLYHELVSQASARSKDAAQKTSKRTRGKENPTLLISIQPTAFIIEASKSESALASIEPITSAWIDPPLKTPSPLPAKLEQTTGTAESAPERKIMRQRARVRAGAWMGLSYIMLHNTINKRASPSK